MAEKEDIFKSKVKYGGVFQFNDFYKFCYDYITEELGYDLGESKYVEKVSGDSKNIDILWEGEDKVDDYFKFKIKVAFQILAMKNVEVQKDGKTISANKASVETSIKGTLIRDYKGEYETSPSKKFMRRVYNKWIIPQRIEQMEGKLIGDCDEFLGQAKSFLDLSGQK